MNNKKPRVVSFDLDKPNTLFEHIETTKSQLHHNPVTDDSQLIFYIVFTGEVPHSWHMFLTDYLGQSHPSAEFLFRGNLTHPLYNGINDKSKINIFRSTVLFDKAITSKINII